MSTIENRLAKLERKLRFYQLGVTVILIGAVFFIVTAFNNKNAAPDLIQAKEFQVVDANGKVLISLKKDYKAGNIKMYSETGSNIIDMRNSDGGTGIIITKNKSGNMACRLTSYKDDAGNDDGSGKIEVYNKDGKLVSEVGSLNNGSGYFAVKNSLGTKVSEMSSTESSGGWIGVYNNNGYEVGQMSTTTGNTGFLGLYNETGKDMFKVTYTTGLAEGSLSIYNSSGDEQINLSTTTNHDGVISVYNHLKNRVCVLGADNNSNGVLNVKNSAGEKMNGVWPKD